MRVTKELLSAIGCPDRKAFDLREEQIVSLLRRSDVAVEQAVLRIFDRQTEDEKAAEATLHDNGVGFQACDARRGAYWARLIRSGRHLFADRMPKARSMAIKYRKQLTVLSFLKDMAKRGAPKSAMLAEMAIKRGEKITVVRPTSHDVSDGDTFESGVGTVRIAGRTGRSRSCDGSLPDVPAVGWEA